jgi:hypothetical protein
MVFGGGVRGGSALHSGIEFGRMGGGGPHRGLRGGGKREWCEKCAVGV